jgi:3-oxoacyl-(acyl-carrier-protein) synthase
LLFPETVFNAPASHLAAILGITGSTYTLVGDGAVGILALKMAEDLMLNEAIDHCLVVSAEEADWLLCDAYRRWRLTKAHPPIKLFGERPAGTILSEGAGAVVIGRKGVVELDRIDEGGNFHRRADAETRVTQVLAELAHPAATLLIASANGTFIDLAECAAVKQVSASMSVYSPKAAMGDSVGASGAWQVILATQVLLTNRVPVPQIQGQWPKSERLRKTIVLTCGMNQQVAGLRLSI